MATTSPFTTRSLLAQAQFPSPRLPSNNLRRVSLSLPRHHNHKQPATAGPKQQRRSSHPAFSAARRAKKIPIPESGEEAAAGVRVTDRGLAYRLDGAPFEFQYSYTEAPHARPVALREAPFLPFGPEASPRPWTGRKPLPKSRKELPEFDSFVLPPPGKKGVKPVQSPGPFLAGMEPRYQAASREEVLGEPLTKEEVHDLVKATLKSKRQLNIGRDGLTHNMLENIHSLWKRKRVCKIKCKGVCTVDMDNVCQQLEEKVGGKVIHRQGGVIFLFRGRNYNYRTRPSYPLMLWKPAAPVYPRLVKKIPDDLTLDEAEDMRKRGRQLPPICKLGKNGVYLNLVKQVREAFEACDLVRVACSGLNKSDCRKIGAKLKDLVPCTLLSFEFEHILMWRGNDWKSSLPPLEENNFEVASDQILDSEVADSENALTPIELVNNATSSKNCNLIDGEEKLKEFMNSSLENGELVPDRCGSSEQCPDVPEAFPMGSNDEIHELETMRRNSEHLKGSDGVNGDSIVPPYMEGILLLFKQAVDSGMALILNANKFADADDLYQKSVAFTKTAPRYPVFRHTPRKSRGARKNEPANNVRIINKHLEENKVSDHVKKKDNVMEGSGIQRNDHAQEFLSDVVPQGTLRVDELAKLLV